MNARRRGIHRESHLIARIGWLRAAVLGANDGIISTGSLMLGVASSQANRASVLIAGFSALIAGAMSMAAGEYVSVHSQADSEHAELARERHEIATDQAAEQKELKAIYVQRGLDPALAAQVAEQLMAHDALAAHARDELGITSTMSARPLQAAFASAASFTGGAALPLLTAVVSPHGSLVAAVAASSLLFLAILGALAARMGGAPLLPGAVRVTSWGALAMALTAGVGALSGTAA
jgi:vacuolar iron transporter family protein